MVGPDYVMMGADSSSSGGGGISLTSSNIDKIAVIHDGNGSMRTDDRREVFRELENSMNSHDQKSWDNGLNGFDRYDFFNRKSLEQQAIVVGFAGDAADGKHKCRHDDPVSVNLFWKFSFLHEMFLIFCHYFLV